MLLHASSHGYELTLAPVERALSAAVTDAADVASHSLAVADLDALERWVGLARELGVALDVRVAQERAYGAALRARAGRLREDQVAVVHTLGGLLGLSPVAWAPRRR
jgi:uncharacterized protein GlcG (DUF336 family)